MWPADDKQQHVIVSTEQSTKRANHLTAASTVTRRSFFARVFAPEFFG
jgi:hypothetical protein